MKPDVLVEKDGSVTLALDQLEIFVNDEDLEKATNQLLEDVKEYSLDYVRRSQLFLNAPNRRVHFPYVLRVLMCENDEEIRGLFRQ